ncbi:MAG: DUF4349 domain-containing protein [Chloroflexi bacterium]|nr:MAG: DUF4349 domain-containing protein [Chloroflexota bacterium]
MKPQRKVNAVGKIVLAIAALALVLGACSQAGAPATAPSAAGRGQVATGYTADSTAVKAAAPAPDQGIPTVVVSADRNLILTAKIDMRSKDPWATSQAVQQMTTSLGGDVLSVNESGTTDNRNASLSIRVPSRSFQEAIRQIRALDGEVQSSNVSGQDVTDQFVDLQARLTAKQAEEARYNALLVRANTIDEILKIDSALSNVRTQVEQLTGQINSIKSRTDYSTISMSVSPITVLGPAEQGRSWDPAKTVARAVATLAAMMQVLGDLAIWLIIFGWIPLLALAAVFVATRSRRPAVNTPTA